MTLLTFGFKAVSFKKSFRRAHKEAKHRKEFYQAKAFKKQLLECEKSSKFFFRKHGQHGQSIIPEITLPNGSKSQDQSSHPEICAEDYRGSAPFSEPETQAMKAFIETQHFEAAFNYHAFGQYFNIPNSCKQLGEPKGGTMDVPCFLDLVFLERAVCPKAGKHRFQIGKTAF